MDRMGGKQLVNKVLVLLVIAAVAGAAFGGLWLLPPGDAYASNHSATRSFSATSVAPGETVTVTIQANNYGSLGRIVETVPSGFTTLGRRCDGHDQTPGGRASNQDLHGHGHGQPRVSYLLGNNR